MDGLNTVLDKAEERFDVLDWRKKSESDWCEKEKGNTRKHKKDFSDIVDRKILSNVCLIEDLERKI